METSVADFVDITSSPRASICLNMGSDDEASSHATLGTSIATGLVSFTEWTFPWIPPTANNWWGRRTTNNTTLSQSPNGLVGLLPWTPSEPCVPRLVRAEAIGLGWPPRCGLPFQQACHLTPVPTHQCHDELYAPTPVNELINIKVTTCKSNVSWKYCGWWTSYNFSNISYFEASFRKTKHSNTNFQKRKATTLNNFKQQRRYFDLRVWSSKYCYTPPRVAKRFQDVGKNYREQCARSRGRWGDPTIRDQVTNSREGGNLFWVVDAIDLVDSTQQSRHPVYAFHQLASKNGILVCVRGGF